MEATYPGPGHAQLRPEPGPRDGDCGGRHQGRLGRLPRGEVSSDWWTRGHVTAILTPDWSQRRPRAGEPGLQAGRQHHQGRQRHGAPHSGRHPGRHQELRYHYHHHNHHHHNLHLHHVAGVHGPDSPDHGLRVRLRRGECRADAEGEIHSVYVSTLNITIVRW